MTRPPNTTVTTPSGITIDYYDAVGVDGEKQTRRYLVNGEKLVSVSTVAGIFDKPALPSWAARVTLEGIEHLLWHTRLDPDFTPVDLRHLLRKHGLDHDSVRDAAAERGTAAHDALVKLLAEGKVPNPSDYPVEQRGYIQAGARWAEETEPEIIDAERIVASVEHGFAGRFDLLCRIGERVGRIDFKTLSAWSFRKSKGEPTDELLPPYPENLVQLAGYELAAVESGYDPSDFQAVVRLGPDGRYDMTESWAEPRHFLDMLAAYRSRADLNAIGTERRKAEKKQAKEQLKVAA
ncbi:MAG: hypothetical protein M3355_11890 [Actinomycetota bacterium]|nr:hypothetical protein [Actinomycetota bacterium]